MEWEGDGASSLSAEPVSTDAERPSPPAIAPAAASSRRLLPPLAPAPRRQQPPPPPLLPLLSLPAEAGGASTLATTTTINATRAATLKASPRHPLPPSVPLGVSSGCGVPAAATATMAATTLADLFPLAGTHDSGAYVIDAHRVSRAAATLPPLNVRWVRWALRDVLRDFSRTQYVFFVVVFLSLWKGGERSEHGG